MSRRKRLSREPVIIKVETLSHEGRGIGHVDGKTVFINEALPGETVSCQYTRQKSRYSEAGILEILQPSPERIAPRCEFYSICGGCSFQHASPEYQITHKQSALLDQLERIGNVQPDGVLPPLTGPVWGYRRKARLGVKYVEKKNRVLTGFREKNSSFIADIKHCDVLHPGVGNMLEDLQDLVGRLSIQKQLPQIEVAVSDEVIALVFRILSDPSIEDREKLVQFEREKDINMYLQPGGLDSIYPLSPDRVKPLVYHLPGHGLRFGFSPTDFVQVNFEINRKMVDQALSLLQPDKSDTVLDLFCGLGNFSLPLAMHSKHVTGIEGDDLLVGRARHNALLNGISNADFKSADLSAREIQAEFIRQNYGKILLDPPRTGAETVLRQLPLEKTERLVYVSCNPATLARDAGILVGENGFRLKLAGVMDMFPHTTHVESIALFTR